MTTEKRPSKTRGAKRMKADSEPHVTIERRKFSLFVAGLSPRSERARINLATALANWNLPKDSYDVEIVDVFKAPTLAVSQGIMATPALFVDCGNHRRMLVGDLSDVEVLMSFLSDAAK